MTAYEKARQEAIASLTYRREKDNSKMWTVYFLGKRINLGARGTYRTKSAMSARVNELASRHGVVGKQVMKDLQTLGILEIRQVDDRSPIFPDNIKGLDPNLVQSIRQMTLSTDKEMIDLAINILENLKDK